MKPTFIDLFCGAGGFSKGMKDAGWKPLAGVDSDESALRTYTANFSKHGAQALNMSLGSKPSRDKLFELFAGKVDAVVGGPPCQGFSKANKSKSTVPDPRNSLPLEFARIAVALGASIALMEEVPAFHTHSSGRTLARTLETFRDAGYDVHHDVVDCKLYGLPQSRKRFVLAAVKKTFAPPSFPPPPSHPTPVPAGRAISRPIAPPGPCDAAPPATSEYAGKTGNPPGHSCRRKLQGALLQKVKDRERQGRRYNDERNFFPGAYGLLDLSRPSTTITTQIKPGNGAFTLKAPRGAGYFVVSMQDAQRLQGFPESYMFRGSAEERRKQIGNAAPPPVARALGKWALAALSETGARTVEN